MGELFRGGDTITDGKVTGEIHVTQFALHGGLQSVKYFVNGTAWGGGIEIAHADATRLAYGRHQYESHASRRCAVCGVAKAQHGDGARPASEAPGPPPEARPERTHAAQPIAGIFEGAEVRSSFQDKPAYRYIRASDQLPRYDQLDEADGHTFDTIQCRVKLFNPTGAGTWWIAAYDPDTHTAWGVAEIHEREVGSFSMDELARYRGQMLRLPVERDIHWKPATIASLLANAVTA